MGAMDDAWGTVLIGSWLSSGLFMLQIVWAVEYFNHSASQDGIYFRILVPFVILVDLFGLIAGVASAYLTCVTHWGDTEYLKRQSWTVPCFLMAEAVVCATVQGFLVFRYLRLSKNRYIASALAVCVLFALGAGFTTGVFTIKWPAFEDRQTLELPMRMWLITDAITDGCISLALIYELRRQRNGLKTTDTMIRRLTFLSIQSALIPALCAAAALIAYTAKPTSNDLTVFLWFLPRFYILSLLYTLNIRESLRGGARIAGSNANTAANYTIGGIHIIRAGPSIIGEPGQKQSDKGSGLDAIETAQSSSQSFLTSTLDTETVQSKNQSLVEQFEVDPGSVPV